nr:MAG TPA: hypothetical protein [Caudoviricetes sp.]
MEKSESERLLKKLNDIYRELLCVGNYKDMIEGSLISGDTQTALRFTGYQGAKLGVLLSLIQEAEIIAKL